MTRAERCQLPHVQEVLGFGLGDHLFTSLIRNKEIEWEEYRSIITDYEIKRYLPSL